MSMTALNNDCQIAMENLKMLNNEELNEILNSDDKIEEILVGLEQSYLKNIESEKSMLLENNSKLAEINLAREPELVEGRQKVADFSAQGEELARSVEEKFKELKEKSGDMSLETTLALLQTAASESEEQSETIANKFLDGDIELDDFLTQFLTMRQLMHIRLVKAEKMTKIVSQDLNFSSGPNYINAPPVAINSNYFPSIPTTYQNNPSANSVPYPTGPLNMPMPGGMNYFQYH